MPPLYGILPGLTGTLVRGQRVNDDSKFIISRRLVKRQAAYR